MELSCKCIDEVVNAVLVALAGEVEEAVQGEALERAVLDLLPHLVIDDVELGEQRPVGYVGIEALRVDPGRRVLDKPLDHLDVRHFFAVVHRIDLVLPAVGQELLRHFADRVGVEDQVVFGHFAGLGVNVAAVDREVGAHNDAANQPLFLVGHGEALG